MNQELIKITKDTAMVSAVIVILSAIVLAIFALYTLSRPLKKDEPEFDTEAEKKELFNELNEKYTYHEN